MANDSSIRSIRLAFVCFVAAGLSLSVVLLLSACGSRESSISDTPQVTAKSKIDAGRYLVKVAGCNECHTAGWMQGERPPESQWLTGVPVGWRGPWGTTYATNLRLAIRPYATEDMFVKTMKMRSSSPPMPWESLHQMSDADVGAIYSYIFSLGEAGSRMPSNLPPNVEPDTAYISLLPVTKGESNRPATSMPGGR